jgi:hypothetical protein
MSFQKTIIHNILPKFNGVVVVVVVLLLSSWTLSIVWLISTFRNSVLFLSSDKNGWEGGLNVTHFGPSHKVRSGWPIWGPTGEGEIYLMGQTELSVDKDGASLQHTVFRMLSFNDTKGKKPNWSAIVMLVMMIMVIITILRTSYLVIVFVMFTV